MFARLPNNVRSVVALVVKLNDFLFILILYHNVM